MLDWLCSCGAPQQFHRSSRTDEEIRVEKIDVLIQFTAKFFQILQIGNHFRGAQLPPLSANQDYRAK
ncbi:hypothetical protein AJ88_07900 [Mesorhizobium amorphae CCBAU 01583]|nr:hypothetical protein AJ88_07900 [Mesorhizobium amorphae CCBAU 01583]